MPLMLMLLSNPGCVSRATTAATDGGVTRCHCLHWVYPTNEYRGLALYTKDYPYDFKCNTHLDVIITGLFSPHILSGELKYVRLVYRVQTATKRSKLSIIRIVRSIAMDLDVTFFSTVIAFVTAGGEMPLV